MVKAPQRTPPEAVTTAPDEEIIERVLAGHREAFHLLVTKYSDPLYRHALGMTGSPDVAEDIIQVSFIKAYQHLGEVRGRFDAWLFRILANGCKDWLKNIRRTKEFVVNLADEGTANAMHLTSTELPESESEFAKYGLTPVPAARVQHPRIAEAAASFECRLEPTMAEQLHVTYAEQQTIGNGAVGDGLDRIAQRNGEVAKMAEGSDALRRFGDEQRVGSADQPLAPAVDQLGGLEGTVFQQLQRFRPGGRRDRDIDTALQPEWRERLADKADPAPVFDREQARQQPRKRGGAEHQVVVAVVGHGISEPSSGLRQCASHTSLCAGA